MAVRAMRGIWLGPADGRCSSVTAAAASLILKPVRRTSNGRPGSLPVASTPSRSKLARNSGCTDASAATTSARFAAPVRSSRSARMSACKPLAQAAVIVSRTPAGRPSRPHSASQVRARPNEASDHPAAAAAANTSGSIQSVMSPLLVPKTIAVSGSLSCSVDQPAVAIASRAACAASPATRETFASRRSSFAIAWRSMNCPAIIACHVDGTSTPRAVTNPVP